MTQFSLSNAERLKNFPRLFERTVSLSQFVQVGHRSQQPEFPPSSGGGQYSGSPGLLHCATAQPPPPPELYVGSGTALQVADGVELDDQTSFPVPVMIPPALTKMLQSQISEVHAEAAPCSVPVQVAAPLFATEFPLA
jgi:hypothetical protein